LIFVTAVFLHASKKIILKDNLEGQVKFMQEKFPNAETITDIGAVAYG
jgi:hypothetical protein